MFTARQTTYVPGTTPVIKSTDLNWLQDQSALLARLAITGRRVYDDFHSPGSTPAPDATLWGVFTTGTASALCVSDSSHDGFGCLALTVGAGASNVEVSSAQIPIGTRDFYMRFRVRHVSGTSYNYGFGLSSGTNANIIRVLVSSGGGGAMTVGVGTGGTGVSITPTLGTTFSDLVFTRIGGVLTLTVNGSLAYGPVSNTANLNDVELDMFNNAGAADVCQIDTVCLLVDQ